jgi:hypothetical protein
VPSVSSYIDTATSFNLSFKHVYAIIERLDSGDLRSQLLSGSLRDDDKCFLTLLRVIFEESDSCQSTSDMLSLLLARLQQNTLEQLMSLVVPSANNESVLSCVPQESMGVSLLSNTLCFISICGGSKIIFNGSSNQQPGRWWNFISSLLNHPQLWVAQMASRALASVSAQDAIIVLQMCEPADEVPILLNIINFLQLRFTYRVNGVLTCRRSQEMLQILV